MCPYVSSVKRVKIIHHNRKLTFYYLSLWFKGHHQKRIKFLEICSYNENFQIITSICTIIFNLLIFRFYLWVSKMRNLGNLEVIRISKVSSNDSVPLIYLPKKAVERIGLRKGDYVVLATDGRRLIIEKLELNSQGG